jgi:uncharacterized protein (TIGR02391 family)
MNPMFSQSQLTAIADALADTSEGLSGSEIAHLLTTCKMSDPSPGITKRRRLYNAFVESQNSRQDRKAILAFIRHSMKPELYARNPERFEPMRTNLNRALAFASLSVDASGTLSSGDKATTLAEAERRAQDLRADLVKRGVHPDVLQFCKAELIVDNYFHAVQEATKSIAAKLRARTGLTDDGGTLVDRSLGGDLPMLAINALKSESEKSEQRGFVNLLKGTFGMFRNPTAHEARILWNMDKADAEDLLSLASLVHRRLDKATMPPRA